MRFSLQVGSIYFNQLMQYDFDTQCESLGRLQSFMNALSWVYDCNKEITRLEDLEKSEKLEYWELACKYTDKDNRLKYCKSLMVIYFLFHKQN